MPPMIFRREITLLCKFAGTVKIFLKCRRYACAPPFRPPAAQGGCRSRAQKGALNDGIYKADRRRGRRVAGIRLVHLHRHDIRCGCADLSLHFFNGAGRAFAAPYNVPMACSVARRVEIIGTTRLCEAALISSCATKFNGSLMATKSSSFTSFTGTTLYFFSRWRAAQIWRAPTE